MSSHNTEKIGIAVLMAVVSTLASAQQPLGCLIEPSRVVEVGSPVIGVVESVKVERGDRVKTGQVIAMLRADVERAAVGVAQSRATIAAEVRAAEANYELARQKLTRAKGLVSQKFISDQALEQAHAETEVARQRLEQAQDQRRIWERELQLAQAQLELRTIRSPADGVIVERYMTGGERVEEKPIVRVATINPLKVEIVVPASLYGTIPLGAELTITPELPNAKPRKAKVTLVDTVIDGPSNTFRVRLDLPNPNYDLPPGPRCKVELSADGKSAAAKADAKPAAKSDVKPITKGDVKR